MEAQKTVAKMEQKIKGLTEKSVEIENQLVEVVGKIRNVTSRLNASEEVASLSKKKMDLMEEKEKLQKDLKVTEKEMSKLQKSINVENDLRFPVIHPNMPYIESAIEKTSTDIVENDTDDDDDGKAEANDSDDKYANFVPHPNISISRDSEYKKKMQNKKEFVPHPNIRLSRNEIRDCESEQITLSRGSYQGSNERKINSVPIIKHQSNLKCSCIKIDKDILEKCDSYNNCKVCLKAIKAFDPKSKVGCPSKISFSPEVAANDGEKSLSKMKGACSVLLNCTSYVDCPNCASFIKNSKKPHIATCQSYVACKNCEALKNEQEETGEAEMSEVSVKSSFFEDSCASFKQCRECEIARQVKKVEKKRKIAETPTHRHCSKSFCIPFFVKQCSNPCSSEAIESITSTRPVTAPIIQDLQPESTPSTVQFSKSYHKIDTYPQSCKSMDFCTNCQHLKKIIPSQQELQVFQALLHAESIKSLKTQHDSVSSPKIQQKVSQESRPMANLCQSFAFCQNCSSFAPITKIPTEMLTNYESVMKSCKSVNTCKNCRQVAMSTLNKRQSIDVPTSDNDGVLQSTSELKKIIRESLPEEKKTSRLFTTPAVDTSSEAVESDEKLDWKKSSILNQCSSFGVCAKCMECIWQQTVVRGCESEPECKLCAHILESIDGKQKKEYQAKKLRYSSINQGSKISRSLKSAISKSMISPNSSKNLTLADDSGDSSKSYEQMKLVIEKQNEVIRKIQEKIRVTASRKRSEETVKRLSNSLGEAKLKLRKLVQMAIIEQKKHQDENWKPITVSLIDDY